MTTDWIKQYIIYSFAFNFYNIFIYSSGTIYCSLSKPMLPFITTSVSTANYYLDHYRREVFCSLNCSSKILVLTCHSKKCSVYEEPIKTRWLPRVAFIIYDRQHTHLILCDFLLSVINCAARSLPLRICTFI